MQAEAVMQVTEHVHALKIPFRLQAGEGRILDRFVYAYVVFGARTTLIDCGVAGSGPLLIDYVRQAGRDPADIAAVLLTHAHPDHMGGLLELKTVTGCRVAAHPADTPWVQDVGQQNRERPIRNFAELVEGDVKVDTLLHDGERIEGVEVLLSSWDEPRRGSEIRRLLEEAPEYVRDIHRLVIEELGRSPEARAEELSARVLPRLGLPEAAGVPIVIRTIQAHMNARAEPLG